MGWWESGGGGGGQSGDGCGLEKWLGVSIEQWWIDRVVGGEQQWVGG